jgi:hypothetical protein
VGKFDNLNDSQIPELLRRIERLERASPVNNTAIGRDGIEVYDGGVINISNGGLNVVGSGTFTGTLYANGTIAFTGTLTQSGPSTFTGDTSLNGPTHINGATDITGNTTVTGDFTVNGPMKTTGTLSVEGVTTLKNDLNVTTGKVKVGSAMTLDPATDGGGISFSTGAKLSNASGGIGLQMGSAVVGVTSYGASFGTPAANIVALQADGIVGVTGKLQVGTLPTTASPANVYADSSGNFFISTA